MKKCICISVLSGLLFLSALEGTVMAADTTGCMADPCEGKPAEYIADPAGAVTFEHLNHRMREGNLQILALQESIDDLEEIDHDLNCAPGRDTFPLCPCAIRKAAVRRWTTPL